MRIKSIDSTPLYKQVDPELCKVQVIDTDGDSPGGYIEGYASVFGNTDLGGDVVEKGAFKKTLTDRLKKGLVKFVDSHRVMDGTEAIIGVVTEAQEDEYGLKFKAKLSKVQKAQDIRTKVKEGILNALSFGYTIVKDHLDEKTGVRHLKELKLHEISVVPWGMNPLAQMTAAKSVVPFVDWPIHPETGYAWDVAAATGRIKEWASSKAPEEWGEAEWSKYRKCFLWYNGQDEKVLGAYKFPIVDIVDGGPKYIWRAAVAALVMCRGGRGATGPGSDWWAERSDIESQLARIYRKFDKPLPGKEDDDALEMLAAEWLDEHVPDPELQHEDEKVIQQMAEFSKSVEEAAAELKLATLMDEIGSYSAHVSKR